MLLRVARELATATDPRYIVNVARSRRTCNAAVARSAQLRLRKGKKPALGRFTPAWYFYRIVKELCTEWMLYRAGRANHDEKMGASSQNHSAKAGGQAGTGAGGEKGNRVQTQPFDMKPLTKNYPTL